MFTVCKNMCLCSTITCNVQVHEYIFWLFKVTTDMILLKVSFSCLLIFVVFPLSKALYLYFTAVRRLFLLSTCESRISVALTGSRQTCMWQQFWWTDMLWTYDETFIRLSSLTDFNFISTHRVTEINTVYPTFLPIISLTQKFAQIEFHWSVSL